MRLTAWEEERLLIFTAAEVARRHRDRGLPLNAPEAVALICDAMLEAARGGASYEEVEAAGRGAVAPHQVLPGVAALVGDVRLEVLMDDGARLVVLLEPLGLPDDDSPGQVRRVIGLTSTPGSPSSPDRDPADTIDLSVTSTSTRVVRVSSHYPFDRVNRRLEFDRESAHGFRLDLPAGSTERWSPGETRTVRLVRYGGYGGSEGDGDGDGDQGASR
jgi:urease subunit gamma/beta